MSNFSNKEKADEAALEVTMRNLVYGKKGRLTPSEQKRIAMMQEIADEYRKLAEADKPL